MKNVGTTALVLLLSLSAAHAGGDLFGTIRTTDGRELTGPMRWDNNENFWDDVLDASKIEELEVEDDGFQLNLFGVDLIKVAGSSHRSRAGFSIPFGHLKAIERDGRHAARLILKNGETIEVRADADLGSGMRGVVIDDAIRGSQELSWSSIERVEFRQNPEDGRDAERLFGTVESRGGTFEGYVVWDRDESMFDDVLDGYAEREEHEIPFERIRSIEQIGHLGSRVTLKDGQVLELDGTNDVDDGHRGVAVRVEKLGTVEIEWDDFVKVTFADPPPSPAYETFDGGGRLAGKVVTTDGRTLKGTIVWDRDEAYTWESLDGESNHADYSVLFRDIEMIRPLGPDSAEVRLTGDVVLELSGTNDVDIDNRGVVVVSADGTETLLTWDALERVELD